VAIVCADCKSHTAELLITTSVKLLKPPVNFKVPALIVVSPLYVFVPLSRTVPVTPEALILSELPSHAQELASAVEIKVPLMVNV
jgi:hypothetical protein